MDDRPAFGPGARLAQALTACVARLPAALREHPDAAGFDEPRAAAWLDDAAGDARALAALAAALSLSEAEHAAALLALRAESRAELGSLLALLQGSEQDNGPSRPTLGLLAALLAPLRPADAPAQAGTDANGDAKADTSGDARAGARTDTSADAGAAARAVASADVSGDTSADARTAARTAASADVTGDTSADASADARAVPSTDVTGNVRGETSATIAARLAQGRAVALGLLQLSETNTAPLRRTLALPLPLWALLAAGEPPQAARIGALALHALDPPGWPLPASWRRAIEAVAPRGSERREAAPQVIVLRGSEALSDLEAAAHEIAVGCGLAAWTVEAAEGDGADPRPPAWAGAQRAGLVPWLLAARAAPVLAAMAGAAGQSFVLPRLAGFGGPCIVLAPDGVAVQADARLHVAEIDLPQLSAQERVELWQAMVPPVPCGEWLGAEAMPAKPRSDPRFALRAFGAAACGPAGRRGGWGDCGGCTTRHTPPAPAHGSSAGSPIALGGAEAPRAASSASRSEAPRAASSAGQADAPRAASSAGQAEALHAATSPGPAEALHAAVRAAARELGAWAQISRDRVPLDAWIGQDDIQQELKLLLVRCAARDEAARGLGPLLEGRLAAGVKALFVGASGTGKTLAAQWVADRLARPLLRVDLGSVVSKYIGETEKNLGALLARAEHVDAVLLFDEADSLFGARTDVRQANDRYANMQTNYLLQRLETFRGLAILTSNSRARFDEAFVRRLDAAIEFPLPDAAQRERLWALHLGSAACGAVAPGTAARIAALADLPGGHIRNAALTAALLARARASSGAGGEVGGGWGSEVGGELRSNMAGEGHSGMGDEVRAEGAPLMDGADGADGADGSAASGGVADRDAVDRRVVGGGMPDSDMPDGRVPDGGMPAPAAEAAPPRIERADLIEALAIEYRKLGARLPETLRVVG